ncbi:MAG: hypothetical protein ACRD3P_09165 [Terriglobales bacterium]
MKKNAKETGVYVIHHAGNIKYVGKTDSPTMSFGARLRREFQEGASGGRHNYPKLAALTIPPEILVSFFSAKAVGELVKMEGFTLSGFGKIRILEIALTHTYNPEFQRHDEARVQRQLRELGLPENTLALMEQMMAAKRS